MWESLCLETSGGVEHDENSALNILPIGDLPHDCIFYKIIGQNTVLFAFFSKKTGDSLTSGKVARQGKLVDDGMELEVQEY